MASSEMANENSQRGLCVHQRDKQAAEKEFQGNANSSTDKRAKAIIRIRTCKAVVVVKNYLTSGHEDPQYP